MAQEAAATKENVDLLLQEMTVLEQKLMVNTWVVGTALVGVMAAFNFLG